MGIADFNFNQNEIDVSGMTPMESTRFENSSLEFIKDKMKDQVQENKRLKQEVDVLNHKLKTFDTALALPITSLIWDIWDTRGSQSYPENSLKDINQDFVRAFSQQVEDYVGPFVTFIYSSLDNVLLQIFSQF